MNVDTMAKLLQHGPLSRREAIAITGWPGRRCDKTIENLRLMGEVRRVNVGGESVYRLTDSARVRAFAEGAGA